MGKIQLSPLLFIIKSFALLTGSLYLCNFGFYGVNIFGCIDALIPFERGMLIFVALIFMFMWFFEGIKFWKTIEWKKK
jgi:hypothetical protein